MAARGSGNIWSQDNYVLRKKFSIVNKYFIEDPGGNVLGYSKQKMFKLKEDIRIYADETMTRELFHMKQQEILDVWATFAIVDSSNGKTLGFVKRNAISSMFVIDKWEVYNKSNKLIGTVAESAGRGMARKYLSNIIPARMRLEINQQPIASLDQRFKIIGDIWDIACFKGAKGVDRRVLIGVALLMSMIERTRK